MNLLYNEKVGMVIKNKKALDGGRSLTGYFNFYTSVKKQILMAF